MSPVSSEYCGTGCFKKHKHDWEDEQYWRYNWYWQPKKEKVENFGSQLFLIEKRNEQIKQAWKRKDYGITKQLWKMRA